MKDEQLYSHRPIHWRLWVGLALAIRLVLSAAAADVKLPLLQTKQGTYTNVLVTSQTATDIFIQHAGGLGNVKLADIQDEEALQALGLKAVPKKKIESTPVAKSEPAVKSSPATSAPPANVNVLEAMRHPETRQAALDNARNLLPPTPFLLALLGGFAACYVFASYCLKLICEKAGHPPGALVWIPVVQMIPALRAAQMSPWWLLAMFVPLLNVVAQILWCFKITEARGKSVWVAVLLIVPGPSLFAFLYLAFSDAAE